MNLDTTSKFLAAKERNMTSSKSDEIEAESKARKESISDIEKYTKKNRMAFSEFEINMASASAKLKEVGDSSDGNGVQINKVVEELESLNELNGKSNQEQKIGLAKLEGLNKQIANVNDKATRTFLQEQADLLKDGLSKQSNLSSLIAEKFDKQADNIGGVFGAVLGNSPLAGMVTKFFIKSAKDALNRRADVKIARSDAAKDAAKAIHASKEIVDAVEESPKDDLNRVQKVEIVGQTESLKLDKKTQPKEEETKTTSTPTIPPKETLANEEKRREDNRKTIINNRKSKVSKPKSKGSGGSSMLMIGRLLGLVLGTTLGGVAMKALSPLVGAVSSLVRFVPTAIKGMAKLIPGVNLGDSSTTDNKKNNKKGNKTPTQKKSRGSFVKKLVRGGSRLGGMALRGGAALLGGATGAVVGAGAAGYALGTVANDTLLTNEDGSGKVSNFMYDMINPKTEKERSQENKTKYLQNTNSLIRAGATPKQAKQAMKEGKLEETLQMLRMKKSNKDNNQVTSLKKSEVVASTGADVRAIDANVGKSVPSEAPNVINAPNNTVVNNNNNTTVRQRPHLANSDTSFIAANMSGAM